MTHVTSGFQCRRKFVLSDADLLALMHRYGLDDFSPNQATQKFLDETGIRCERDRYGDFCIMVGYDSQDATFGESTFIQLKLTYFSE